MTTTTTDLVAVDGITATGLGLVIDDDLPCETWAEAGEVLARAEGSLLWAVGDWMRYGDEHYGAKATQLAAAIGLAPKTVWNATSVCRRVLLERRRPDLSFSHHEAIAAQPPEAQVMWLELAAGEGLSVHALRERMMATRPDRELPDVGKSTRRVPVRFNVTFPVAQVPDEVIQEGVHHAAQALHSFLAERGYETDIAEVL